MMENQLQAPLGALLSKQRMDALESDVMAVYNCKGWSTYGGLTLYAEAQLLAEVRRLWAENVELRRGRPEVE